MLIGILSDTHNKVERTRAAAELLKQRGAELLIHCGDLCIPEIVQACQEVLPLVFVFGNNDSDMTRLLQEAADEVGATCLAWGGSVEVAGKQLAVVHGHLTSDYRPLIEAEPDYLFSGHSHYADDWQVGPTRRINPGALHRAEQYSVALLNLETDELELIVIEK